MSGTPYIQPHSLDELNSLLPSLPSKTAVLAGGTDLMPKIRGRRREYDAVLSIIKIPELKTIEECGGWLKIGSTVTHAHAACDAAVRKHFNALRMACAHVGSQQIRNKGTIGGSIMNASPAGDMAPCVFLFGGEVEIMTAAGIRRLGIGDFVGADGRIAIPGILLAIYLPIDKELHSSFIKLGTRREVTIAQISLCASWKGRGENRLVMAAYAGAIDQRPYRLPEPQLLASYESADTAAERLACKIREIRENRKRPPKLKITDAERQYKERAVKGVVYDLIESMPAIENS